MAGGLWRARKVYNEKLIRQKCRPTGKRCPAHQGVRAHDAAMAQDSGVGSGSAVTDGDDVSKRGATE